MNPTAAASPVSAHTESVLLAVILQLIVIIAAARIFGVVFRRFGQPQVCGEIAAGLILGPSLLGGWFPGAAHFVFNPGVGPIFSVLSQIGLVLLMFLIGLEFDFGHLATNSGTALGVSITGILLPFSLGLALGHAMHGWLELPGSWVNFSLFMGTAMSITAIPILGRIMIEMGINRTRIGSLTISSAAFDDAAGWIMLALVTAIVKSQFDPGKLALMTGEVALFAAVMVLAVRPLAIRWIRTLPAAGELPINALAILLILIFSAAAVTNLIGIFSIFGAFFLGAVLYDQTHFAGAVKRRLSDFITVFFLPIFFTYTGLRTDIGTMSGAAMWGMCGLVLAAAVTGKFGGCTLAARWSGNRWRESAIIGVMMNTRALMELIVVNIGYDLGVIPKSVFFMLVLMAVTTTYITAPVLRRLLRGSELEADYARSGFAAPAAG